jgi:hypothetical protein
MQRFCPECSGHVKNNSRMIPTHPEDNSLGEYELFTYQGKICSTFVQIFVYLSIYIELRLCLSE